MRLMRRLLVLLLLPAFSLLTGCGDDDDTPFDPGPSVTLLITNLSGPENAEISLDSGLVAAVGFTMPDTSYLLSFVRLKLRIGLGQADGIVTQLYGNDASGNPGALLLTLDGPIAPVQNGLPEIDSFLAPSAFTLQADSTYWVVVHNAWSGPVAWICGSPSTAPGGVATHYGSKVGYTVPPTTSSASIGEYSVTGRSP